MRDSNIDAAGPFRPLRIWIPVILLGAMLGLRQIPLMIEDGPAWLWMLTGFGPTVCSLLVLLWWLFASRATAKEKIAGVLGLVVAAVVTVFVSDDSVLGPVLISMTIPMGFAAFALAAVLGARVLAFRRTWIAVLVGALAFAPTALVRSQGMTGDFELDLYWRWATSSEELMLAEERASTPGPDTASDRAAAVDVSAPEWPGFRGPMRDGRDGRDAHDPALRLSTDWDASPPELLWSRRIGPGWSSFAVAGAHVFTQEQRGPIEATVCLDAETGERVWSREIEARFDDPLGGPGPRATPTLALGSVFVLGARGNLARLDAATGNARWEVELTEVAERDPPSWGFASSPLVVGDLVVVWAGGANGKGTLAFRADSGELAWSAESGDHSYSSPQLATLHDEAVILMVTNLGLDLLDPIGGELRLHYEWPNRDYRALQPHPIGNDVLVPTGMGVGTRRVRVSKSGSTWSADEVWTSRRLVADFNDFVVHGGNAFGFDGSMFACVNLDTGERRWKQGRYGKGQVVLLESSDLLLVAAESGEVFLLAADPSAHRELTGFEALEGKTWNHPVVVGDRLYVRNAEQAACYRLP